MSALIERAGRAAFEHEHVSDGCTWDGVGSMQDSRDAWCGMARAALLAALDPEDEALVERIAGAIAPGYFISEGCEGHRNQTRKEARAVIKAIRAFASPPPAATTAE